MSVPRLTFGGISNILLWLLGITPDGDFLATFRGFLGDISGISWRQGYTQAVEVQGVAAAKILYILYIHYKVYNRGVYG